MLITPDILRKIVDTLTQDRAALIAGLINEICPKYGINNKDRLEEFLATLAHESGGFRIKEENLNYTTAARLRAIWPSRFPTEQSAKRFVRQPQLLANLVYGGRMGNNTQNDGWDFRGAGFIQITGRFSFEAYHRYLKFNGTVQQLAAQIRTDDRWAMDSACYVFAIEKQLLDEADNDQFQLITRRINGGLIGWNDRVKYLERCKLYL